MYSCLWESLLLAFNIFIMMYHRAFPTWSTIVFLVCRHLSHKFGNLSATTQKGTKERQLLGEREIVEGFTYLGHIAQLLELESLGQRGLKANADVSEPQDLP